ncbi:MAG: Trp family transcriptional regulator [Lentisphaeria bacterium]
MPKVQLSVIAEEMATVLRSVQNKNDLATFLHGLLTPNELEEIHRRWHLLRGLSAGLTQREIRDTLGISLGKIARGSRLMKYSDDNFPAIVEQILKETKQEKFSSEAQNS